VKPVNFKTKVLFEKRVLSRIFSSSAYWSCPARHVHIHWLMLKNRADPRVLLQQTRQHFGLRLEGLIIAPLHEENKAAAICFLKISPLGLRLGSG